MLNQIEKLRSTPFSQQSVTHALSRLLFLCSLWGMAGTALAQQEGGSASGEIIGLLQQGGYILYIRHGATDHSQQDVDLSDLSDCSMQRNLSQQGIEESRLLGRAINALDIKIDNIYTSPYCRCVDTAKIAFGRYEKVDDMRATFAANAEESRYLVDFLKQQLSTQPKPGFNTVLIGHTANLRELTEVWPKPEGVVHVFNPLGEGDYEHIGRIIPGDWPKLAGLK